MACAYAYYNMACAYAKKPDGEVHEALGYLRKAIDMDEKFKEIAKNDDDFSRIRHMHDFITLVD
jgi:hypothetical protein